MDKATVDYVMQYIRTNLSGIRSKLALTYGYRMVSKKLLSDWANYPVLGNERMVDLLMPLITERAQRTITESWLRHEIARLLSTAPAQDIAEEVLPDKKASHEYDVPLALSQFVSEETNQYAGSRYLHYRDQFDVGKSIALTHRDLAKTDLDMTKKAPERPFEMPPYTPPPFQPPVYRAKPGEPEPLFQHDDLIRPGARRIGSDASITVYRGEPIQSIERLHELENCVGKPYPIYRVEGSAPKIGTYVALEKETTEYYATGTLTKPGVIGASITTMTLDLNNLKDGGIDEAVITANLANMVSSKAAPAGDPLRIEQRKEAFIKALGPAVKKYLNDPLLSDPDEVKKWYDPEYNEKTWAVINSGERAVADPEEDSMERLNLLMPLAEKIRTDKEVIKYFITHTSEHWIERVLRVNSDGSGTKVIKVEFLKPEKRKTSSFQKVSYVAHCPGHRNSKGELAEWCVKSHETGKILSSHKTKQKAKEHLQQMHIHKGSSPQALSPWLSPYKLPSLRKAIQEIIGWYDGDYVDWGSGPKRMVEWLADENFQVSDTPLFRGTVLPAKLIPKIKGKRIKIRPATKNLQSWTSSFKVAKRFGDGALYPNVGVVVGATIPSKYILANQPFLKQRVNELIKSIRPMVRGGAIEWKNLSRTMNLTDCLLDLEDLERTLTSYSHEKEWIVWHDGEIRVDSLYIDPRSKKMHGLSDWKAGATAEEITLVLHSDGTLSEMNPEESNVHKGSKEPKPQSLVESPAAFDYFGKRVFGFILPDGSVYMCPPLRFTPGPDGVSGHDGLALELMKVKGIEYDTSKRIPPAQYVVTELGWIGYWSHTGRPGFSVKQWDQKTLELIQNFSNNTTSDRSYEVWITGYDRGINIHTDTQELAATNRYTALLRNKFGSSDSVVYHGTPTKAGYRGIVEDGLSYRPASDKYEGDRASFAPLEGAYLTKDFGNAVRYAFMSESDYETEKAAEPYGYVFEFNRSDLSETSPDEDELGSAIHKNLNNPHIKRLLGQMPPDLRDKMLAPEVSFETYALVGKWVIRNAKLPKQVLDDLMKDSRNLVNYGKMRPTAVWAIPKSDEQFLRDADGSFNTANGWAEYAKKRGVRKQLKTASAPLENQPFTARLLLAVEDGRITAEEAEDQMRSLFWEPLEPYPGNARKLWKSRCIRCGTTQINISLRKAKGSAHDTDGRTNGCVACWKRSVSDRGKTYKVDIQTVMQEQEEQGWPLIADAKRMAQELGGDCISTVLDPNNRVQTNNLKNSFRLTFVGACAKGDVPQNHEFEISIKRLKEKYNLKERFICDKCSKGDVGYYIRQQQANGWPLLNAPLTASPKGAKAVAEFMGGKCLNETLDANRMIPNEEDIYFRFELDLQGICGHKFSRSYRNLIAGYYSCLKTGASLFCPKCSKSLSQQEEVTRHLFEFYTGKNWPKLSRAKSGIKHITGLEIDGFCKELNLGFEFNGPDHYENTSWRGRFADVSARDKTKFEQFGQLYGTELIIIPFFKAKTRKALAQFIVAALKSRGVALRNQDVVAPTNEEIEYLPRIPRKQSA